MNFLRQQAQARQASRRLIWMFSLTVILLVVLVNLAVGAFWLIVFRPPTEAATQLSAWVSVLPQGFFITNTAVVLGLVFGGAALEIHQLRSGGPAVAAQMNARRIAPDTQDPDERRLLNVVEEMAIASRLPVPPAYILEEPSINGFAAGWSTQDAVVVLTRGALQHLTRDELQGVVAHEFSHILNGDMRLNLRLIGLLHGIFLLAGLGSTLMQSRHFVRGGGSRRNQSAGAALALFLLGLVLWLLGQLGVFAGRLIKAGVNRQREYLADAAAVQFTRQVDGIGGALRKIGGLTEGSHIPRPAAESFSHLFLSPVNRFLSAGWAATHPPLDERIRRIYGSRRAYVRPQVPVPSQPGTISAPSAGALGLAPLEWPGPVQERSTSISIPTELASTASTPTDNTIAPNDAGITHPRTAVAQLLALLIDPQESPAQQRQLDLLKVEDLAFDPAQVREILRDVGQLALAARLDWLDRATPALQELSSLQRAQLLRLTDAMIASDGRLAPFELLVRVLLRRRLRPEQRVEAMSLERATATAMKVLHHLDHSLDPMLGRTVGQIEPHNMSESERPSNNKPTSAAQTSHPSERLTSGDFDAALETLQRLPPLQKPAIVRDWLKWSWSAKHRADARAVLARLAAVLDTPFLVPDREPPG